MSSAVTARSAWERAYDYSTTSARHRATVRLGRTWRLTELPAPELGMVKTPRGLSRRALHRACSFIAENLGERFTLGDLARQAGVSRFHFARLFR